MELIVLELVLVVQWFHLALALPTISNQPTLTILIKHFLLGLALSVGQFH
jgi:hypothetical protein